MLTKEDQKELDGIISQFKAAMLKPYMRNGAWLFGLTGWMAWHHWHPIAAAVFWTIAVLALIASLKPN